MIMSSNIPASTINAIESICNSYGDLIVQMNGAIIVTTRDRLSIIDGRLGIQGTRLSINADHHLNLAGFIPKRYPIGPTDLATGDAIVMTEGAEKTLASISKANSDRYALLRAQIIQEIEDLVKHDNMVMIGTSLDHQSMHPITDIAYDEDAMYLNGTPLVAWSDINACHMTDHVLISHDNGKILVVAAPLDEDA